MKARRAAREAKAIAVGQAETSLRTMISASRQRVEDFAVQIGALLEGRRLTELDAREIRRMEPLQRALRSAVEANMNAYEDACAKYLDGKIDKERFQEMYVDEIKTLCEEKDSLIADLLHPKERSPFRSIWKVYSDWFSD
jgi:hypothetical protein